MRRFQRSATLLAATITLITACGIEAKLPDDWAAQVEHGNSLVELGNLTEAEFVYASAMASAEREGNHLKTGVVLQNLARLLDRKGQLRDAEKAYLRAIRAFGRVPECDERLVARAHVGLVVVYLQTEQYSRAETLIRRVLADYPGAATPDKASLMGSLGVVLAHKRRFEEAEEVLSTTAEMYLSSSDPEIQEVGAIAAANAAALKMRSGRASEAVASYQQALEVMEAVPRPSPTALAVALADYAAVLDATGQRNSAEEIYRRAIGIAESGLGPAHPILGGLLDKFAQFLSKSGRKAEARTAASASRRIAEASARENLPGHTVPVEALMVAK
jgi:tetratricopeptide (TPR) repeat protein